MVQLNCIQYGMSRTFGRTVKGKVYNHRVPIKYQRFQDNINPDEIVAHYSRDDIDQIDLGAGKRTFKDAQHCLSRKNFLLPNLSNQDLEFNQLFQKELDRQRAIVARINKIRVVVDSLPGKGTDISVDKDISTPYDCARRVHEFVASRSVVAELSPIEETTTITDTSNHQNQSQEQNSLVVKEQSFRPTLWDMHRPLTDSCRIKFRHFFEKDVTEVNRIYWRSCSFVLGMAVRLAFKDEIKVLLHSWPKPNIKSGSFVYDVALNLCNKWDPDEQELRAFTKIMWSIKDAALPFDRLQVEKEVAKQLFSTNPFKLAQIDSMSESNGGKVTVYRCGGLIDISVGPMISNTSQIGRITLAAVHPFESESKELNGVFYRFQGVSLPQQLPMSSFLYQNVLINHAKKLNKASL